MRQLIDELKQQLDGRIDQMQGLLHVEEDETDEKLNLMRESFQSALLDVHNELHQHLHLGLESVKERSLEGAENRTIEEVARLERDVAAKVRSVADEVRAQWQDSLTNSMLTIDGKISEIVEQFDEHKTLCGTTAVYHGTVGGRPRSQNDAQQQLQCRLSSSTALENALRAEILYPPLDLPTDGQRLRVIVTVEACAPTVPKSFELMVPISVKATVGMGEARSTASCSEPTACATTGRGAACDSAQLTFWIAASCS